MLNQEILEMYLRAIKTAVTNDNLRKIFISKVKKDIKYLDKIIKYLKLKGWVDQPPMYPNIPVDTNEQIDCGEAYHLWEHLSYRYNNLEQTSIYSAFAHDGEFKLILQAGQKMIKNQVETLEKECINFGIVCPSQPKTLYTNIEDIDIIDDSYLYGQLIEGMQMASINHAQAVKQSLTNDRIRELFTSLIFSEIDIINKMILYGKEKIGFQSFRCIKQLAVRIYGLYA